MSSSAANAAASFHPDVADVAARGLASQRGERTTPAPHVFDAYTPRWTCGRGGKKEGMQPLDAALARSRLTLAGPIGRAVPCVVRCLVSGLPRPAHLLQLREWDNVVAQDQVSCTRPSRAKPRIVRPLTSSRISAYNYHMQNVRSCRALSQAAAETCTVSRQAHCAHQRQAAQVLTPSSRHQRGDWRAV
jgi:hypothetical protein